MNPGPIQVLRAALDAMLADMLREACLRCDEADSALDVRRMRAAEADIYALRRVIKIMGRGAK